MPYVKDFSTLRGRGSFDLEIPGWLPIKIEYGYDYYSTVLYFFWRVAETNHTFKISYVDLMQNTAGDYETHIKNFLQDFRKEYLGWLRGGLTEPWMREYHEQYKIIVEL